MVIAIVQRLMNHAHKDRSFFAVPRRMASSAMSEPTKNVTARRLGWLSWLNAQMLGARRVLRHAKRGVHLPTVSDENKTNRSSCRSTETIALKVFKTALMSAAGPANVRSAWASR
jgi:hypothetical protein